jgi:hypothetical protein
LRRAFGPIFGREINHTRLEARDPQSAICNSLRCWLILKQEAMKSGNLLRGFMASCFIYFQTEPTTFPSRHPPGAAPASVAVENFFKFLENFTCGGGGVVQCDPDNRFSPTHFRSCFPSRLPPIALSKCPSDPPPVPARSVRFPPHVFAGAFVLIFNPLSTSQPSRL